MTNWTSEAVHLHRLESSLTTMFVNTLDFDTNLVTFQVAGMIDQSDC